MTKFKISATILGAAILTSTLLTPVTADAATSKGDKASTVTVKLNKAGKLVNKKTGKIIKGFVSYKDTLYKNGVKFTGEINKNYYKAGKKATAVYKGKYYKKGILTTATYKGVYYLKGVAFTGSLKDLYYSKGKIATGTFGGLYYSEGKLANGTIGDIYYDKGLVSIDPIIVAENDKAAAAAFDAEIVTLTAAYYANTLESTAVEAAIEKSKALSPAATLLLADNSKFMLNEFKTYGEKLTPYVKMILTASSDSAETFIGQARKGLASIDATSLKYLMMFSINLNSQAKVTAVDTTLAGLSANTTSAGLAAAQKEYNALTVQEKIFVKQANLDNYLTLANIK